MALKNSEQDAATSGGGWKALAANALVLTASLLLSLALAEAAYRLATGVPLLDATDWREEGFRTNRIGERGIPDPQLGWTLQANYRSQGFNTIEHGIRRNFSETAVRTGSILAVGDSFTEGFDEVVDAESWPAHLEKLLGRPVVNGGIAGYATDQVVLRAEQLLPLVKPSTLIIGFTEVDIDRAGLSEAGAPKPWFTVEDGALVFHPPGPLEPKDKETAIGAGLRAMLSHSALANRLFTALAPTFWHPSASFVYKEVKTDPLDVTCRLLDRLKRRAQEDNIRTLLFLQYGGELVLEEPDIIPAMRSVADCARKAGFEVVDQFAPLQAETKGNPDRVAEYYSVYDDGEFGHMTSKGNEHAARLLAKALEAETPPINAQLDGTSAAPNSVR